MIKEGYGAISLPALRGRGAELIALDSRVLTAGIIALVTVIGGYIRLAPPLRVGFPLMDGGLFYLMTKELQANHYILPAFTSYNSAGIPFAYPPLTLYAAGLFSDLTGVSLFDIFRLVPGLISTLTIPVFFVLARSMLRSNALGIISCLVFALLPNTFVNIVTGGGLTRSSGFLFLIATLFFYCSCLARPNIRDYCLVVICLALAVLSHPTPLWYAAFAMLVIWLFKKRTLTTLIQLVAVFPSVALLTSPWWLVVVGYHGIEPFINAASGRGDLGTNQILSFLMLDISGESYVKVAAVFAMIGIFWCLIRREWLLPVMLFGGLLLYPAHRQDPTIPLSMLVAIGLMAVFQPLWEHTRKGSATQGAFRRSMFIIGATWVSIILLVGAWLSAQPAAGQGAYLSKAERVALSWVHDNVPASSRFMVLSNVLPFEDPLTEWFYPLSERASIATYQGREWLPQSINMNTWVGLAYSLQECYTRDVHCLEEWSKETGLSADYVYIRKSSSVNGGEASRLMSESAKQEGYPVVYDSPGAMVISWRATRK